VGGVIYSLYEWALLRGIVILPSRICFMITGDDLRAAPGKLALVARWCRDVNAAMENPPVGSGDNGTSQGIRAVTVHISTPDPDSVAPFISAIQEVRRHASLILHPGGQKEEGEGGITFEVAIGTSGRDEIVSCIRTMAASGVRPDEVDEDTFERCLTFRYTPDLVIKTGEYHLTDFLIWQSVYSEFFFSDVNWRLFRKTDFLRALRDYQARARRFGT
jgi:undecaprenyl diphosphate synthase